MGESSDFSKSLKVLKKQQQEDRMKAQQITKK